MGIILNMDSVGDYNSFLGQETLHPLVSVVDFSRVPPLRHVRKAYGFYAVFLKDLKCGDLRYGRHYYDSRRELLSSYLPARCWAMMTTGNISG